MSVRSRWSGAAAPVLGLLAVLAVLGAPAEAQVVKPFKIKGAGVGPLGLPLPGQDPRPHWIVGEATHLGRHYGEGTVGTDSAVVDLAHGVITGEFGSGTLDDPAPFVFVGANGDALVTYYGRTEFGAEGPGTFTLTILEVLGVDGGGNPILLVEAHWVAEFVVQPDASTGKLHGVTGSWIMDAYSEPFVLGSDDPVAYRWEGEGRLTFPKKK